MSIFGNAISTVTTAANPYLLWIKIGAVIAVLGSLLWAGIWIRGVFSERESLRVSEAAAVEKAARADATTKLYADAWNKNAQLQEGIANAIKNIRVTSNNYITSVDGEPTPPVSDGSSFVLYPGGVPTAMSRATPVPVFTNGTSGGTRPTTAPN